MFHVIAEVMNGEELDETLSQISLLDVFIDQEENPQHPPPVNIHHPQAPHLAELFLQVVADDIQSVRRFFFERAVPYDPCQLDYDDLLKVSINLGKPFICQTRYLFIISYSIQVLHLFMRQKLEIPQCVGCSYKKELIPLC
jgi:hypothetical protein